MRDSGASAHCLGLVEGGEDARPVDGHRERLAHALVVERRVRKVEVGAAPDVLRAGKELTLR